MAARKRTQEEKNLRTLRELASLPANKQCFDCHQRGPTYVNMLVGSFVCTSCSGILRGLNPPHRVKSITMTVFTPEEVEFVRSRGNDYCRQVWLGMYDPRSLLEPESRDESKIKEFMMQKYERKRWYVNPENITFHSQQATPPVNQQQSDHGNSQQQQQQHQNLQYSSDTKPLSTLLGKDPTPLVLQSPPQVPAAAWSQANSNLNQNSVNNNNNNNNRVTVAPPTGNKGLDLLSEFGSDPFAPMPTQTQHSNTTQQPATQPPAHQVSYSSANGNFANFESAFSDSTSSGSSGFTPEGTSASFAVFQNNVISPPPPIINKVESAKVEAPPPADRYAALADLDSLFHAQQDSSSTNGPSPPPPPVPAAPTSVGSTKPWGMNNTATSAAVTNPTSAIFGQPYSSPANPFAVPAPPTDSWNSVTQQPHPSSAQKQQHLFNPFQQQQQQQQQQAFISSPYMTAPNFNNMDAYGAIGSQQAVFNPYLVGSNQAAVAPGCEMGAQQYVMQNGGASGVPFGPGVWANQAHNTTAGVGWMQQPAAKVMYPAVQPQANPFMTGTPAPKLNPGNPFL